MSKKANVEQIAALPTWDLSALFSSIEDPRIDETLRTSLAEAEHFRERFKGNLAREVTTPNAMHETLAWYEQIVERSSTPLLYAELRFAECCTDEVRGALLSRMRSETQKIRNELLFFVLELVMLPSAFLEECIAAPSCARFANFLRNHLLRQPFYLSEAEERILQERELTGRAAFLRLFDEELSRATFAVRKGRNVERLSETAALSLLYSSKRSERKAAAAALTNGLEEAAPRLTLIFNTLAEDKRIEDRLRRYPTAEYSRHLSNEISQEMVDAMTNAVVDGYAIVQRYYRFKAKVLKVPKLYDYDRYAPVLRGDHKMNFAEAQSMILRSFEKFSPRYAEAASHFFKQNWIDAALRKGKRGGAFCSFMTPSTHPVVFLNYTGSLREVFTLAHELGHGLHAYFMKPQGLLNFDTPLTIAETASVFAEMLLFAELQRTITDKRVLLSIYMSKLESIFATVFRQVSMYLFERDVHAARSQGELSVAQFKQLWRKRQTEMFGRSVELSSGYDIWWSYIPHFLHSPFYVYAYAFGELLTLALYSAYDQGRRQDFPEKYIEMLAWGSARAPEQLVAPFGLSLRSESFWKGGISLIDAMERHAEKLFRSI